MADGTRPECRAAQVAPIVPVPPRHVSPRVLAPLVRRLTSDSTHSDLGLKLREHYSAFAIAASLTKSNPMPVILVPSTALGLEAWNAARRPSKNVIKRVLTSNPHHIEILPLNPSAASSLSNLSSGDGHDDGEDDEDQQTLRPQPQRGVSSFLGGGNGGGRSRTNTVSAIVVAPGASADAQRLQAGAGDGLGRGLLS